MEAAQTIGVRHRRRKTRPSTGAEKIVRWLDHSCGALILLLTVATPWLFGTTEDWSVRLMNAGSFLLGALSIAACLLGPRDENIPDEKASRWFSRSFLALNLLLLLFCLIAFFNARASFSIANQAFTYRQGVIPWLPTSYDRDRTLQFFINALAFFSFFWSFRFWLKPRHNSASGRANLLAPRMKLFLWVFAVNGFLVALQGLFQRLSNSPNLLWLRPSYWGTAEGCFGPFSYRGNAADFLNMVWPVTFGFWYLLTQRRDRRSFGIGDGPELLLLPMFLVTAAASFATLSRGGAIVAGTMLLGLIAVLLTARISRNFKFLIGGTLIAIIAVAFFLSGDLLIERFRAAFSDPQLSGRTEIYQNARQIAADFPWFGTGPGTFLSVYHLYRESTGQSWAAFLHDDWLETRVTFGRIGFALVLIQFGLFALWTWSCRKRWISPVFAACLFLSLAGCLFHAKADFPFQTYSIVFTFVAVSALLTSIATRDHAAEVPTETKPIR